MSICVWSSVSYFLLVVFYFFFFFFQAEDGIRDVAVTGVQTCALPILLPFKSGATLNCSTWLVFTPRLACSRFARVRAKSPAPARSTAVSATCETINTLWRERFERPAETFAP